MVGNVLKNIRKIRGLTQYNIARELHVKENTISNYETEHSNPNFDTIYKFIKACDFDIKFVDNKTGNVYNVSEISKEMDF